MAGRPDPDLSSVNRWIVAGVGIVALAAHLAASSSYSNWWWGLNHYFHLDQAAAVILIGVGCVLCLPPSWSALGRASSRLRNAGIFIRRHPSNDVIAAALLAAVFWLLRMPYHFLGDGRFMIRNLERGDWFHATEFLDRWLHHVVLAFSRRLWEWDAATVYAVVSVVAGFAYGLAALRLGGILRHKVFVACALLTLGTVQLFFGYAESYSLATAAMMIYMVLALEFLAARRRFVWVGVALAAGVALHNALLFLVPSFVFLMSLRGEKDRAAESNRIIQGAAVLVTIALTVLLASRRWTAGESPLMLLPVISDSLGQYTLFSWKHLVDFLNQQVLISPLAWIGLVVFLVTFWKDQTLRRSRRFRFLLLASLFPIAFIVLLRPRLGGSRDWDLMSMGVLPYVVTVIVWMASGMAKRMDLRFTAYVFVVVGFFHTVAWVAVNSNPEASLDRFNRMAAENALWPPDRIAAAQSEMGHFFLEQDRPADGLEHLERAVSADPGTARHWDALGVAYIGLKKYSEAEAALRKAVDLDPKDGSAYSNLGRAYYVLGKLDEAEVALRRAVTLDPSSGPAFFNLGKVLAARGQTDMAIEAFGHAATVWPFVPDYWNSLADALDQAGRSSEAAKARRRAAALR